MTYGARTKSRSPQRELLTEHQAAAMLRDLRRGSLARISDVAIPSWDWRVDRLTGVVFENVEFGVRAVGGWRSRAEWRDCEVIESMINPLTLHKSRIASCRFVRVECGQQYVPTFVSTEFEDCLFREASFVELLASRSSFTRVRFEGVRLKRPMWKQSDFVDVVMTGRADDARFMSCNFTRSDLSSLFIRGDSMILDTGLSDVTLPTTDESFMVTSADLAAAFDAVEPAMSLASRMQLQQLREQELAHGRSGYQARLEADHAVWNARLISEMFGIDLPDADTIVDRLRNRRLTAPPRDKLLSRQAPTDDADET